MPVPLIFAALLCSALLAAQERELAAHRFDPLVDHDGRTRIGQLFGHPVVIAGVTQNLKDGVHAAWVAKDLQEEYGDQGLIVIVEDQKPWTRPDRRARIRAFWRKFFPAQVWMSSNLGGEHPDLPITRKRSQRDDKSLVLIGVDGRLVMEGAAEDPAQATRPGDYRVAFVKAVRAELDKRRRGWGEDPLQQKMRAEAFGKGRLHKAHKILAGVQKGSTAAFDPGAAERELQNAFAARLAMIEHHIATARYLAAKMLSKQLARDVKGVVAWEAALAEVVEALDAPEAKAGMKLERRLQRLLKDYDKRRYAKFGIDGIAAVRAFARRHPDNPVGKRAAAMDLLLRTVVAFSKGLTMTRLEEQLREVDKGG